MYSPLCFKLLGFSTFFFSAIGIIAGFCGATAVISYGFFELYDACTLAFVLLFLLVARVRCAYIFGLDIGLFSVS